MKKLLPMLAFLGILTVLLAACGTTASAANSSTSTGNSSSGQTVVVNTTTLNFAQPSVTLKKGDTLELANQASDIHIIGLGQWTNGTAKAESEPGAPAVQGMELSANSTLMIGPWNTVGTYHLYCSIHVGMNLTVYVKA